MRKLVYVLVILITVLSVEQLYDEYGTKEVRDKDISGVLVSTLDHAGIYESECSIEGYYYYGAMYLAGDSAHELLNQLAGYMGVEGEYEFSRSNTDTGYEAVLVKEAESSRLELKLITVEQEENKNLISQNQYISINLKIFNSVSSAFYYRKVVAGSMEKLFDEWEKKNGVTDEYAKRRHNLIDNLDVSVKGKIHGYVQPETQKEVAAGLITAIGAETIFENLQDTERTAENNGHPLYSIYAYTSGINDYVAIGKNKININVVFTYSEDENVTYIHIGSPIINYDY